jgi:hypothetical protein
VLVRVAEFVEIEQFRRQRLAAGVALTLVLVDMDFEFSGHGRHFPRSRGSRRALRFPIFTLVVQASWLRR